MENFTEQSSLSFLQAYCEENKLEVLGNKSHKSSYLQAIATYRANIESQRYSVSLVDFAPIFLLFSQCILATILVFIFLATVIAFELVKLCYDSFEISFYRNNGENDFYSQVKNLMKYKVI